MPTLDVSSSSGALEVSHFDYSATTRAFADKAEPREQVLLPAPVFVEFRPHELVGILESHEHLNLPRPIIPLYSKPSPYRRGQFTARASNDSLKDLRLTPGF